jgi:hypothetical protein
MLGYFYGFWQDWENRHKVTFDGANRLILVNQGVTEIDVKEDLYSDWKEWSVMYDHGKYEPAMRAVGGDPTVGGNFLGSTYFLTNGWRLKSWSGEYRLSLTGNLYTNEGEPAFVSADGTRNNIEISYNISTLVEGFGYDVPGQYSPSELANAVWLFSTAMMNNPGTVGKLLLEVEKKVKENQGLIVAGL